MKKMLFAALAAATTLFSACNKNASTTQMDNQIDTVSYAMGIAAFPPAEYIQQMLMQAGSDSAYTQDYVNGLKDGLKIAEDKKQLAYNLGVKQSIEIYTQGIKGLEGRIFAADSNKHFSVDMIIAGLEDALEKQSIAFKDSTGRNLSQQEVGMILNRSIQTLIEQLNEGNKKAGEDFMKKVATQEGVQALGNGIYYKEIKAGDGKKPATGDKMEIEYEGRLIDGTVFDASSHRGQTAKFAVGVGAVVPGFDIALSNMSAGAEWEVYIPADQAYGPQVSGLVKPYSTLIFKIKAIGIVKEDSKK